MIKIEILTKPIYSTNILDLRNKNYVRKNSINKLKIKKNHHKVWFQKCLKENKIYIIKKNNFFVGYIRIEKKNKNVSWAIKKRFHGKIKFSNLLKKTTNKGLIARIYKDNIVSLVVALKAGFKFYKKNKDILILKK